MRLSTTGTDTAIWAQARPTHFRFPALMRGVVPSNLMPLPLYTEGGRISIILAAACVTCAACTQHSVTITVEGRLR